MTVFNTSMMNEFQIQYKRAQYYNILSYAWEFLSRDVNEKTILLCDECHVLADPNILETLEYLKNISKRARKYNSSIIVVTQSLEDFLNEKIKLYAQSLLTNASYKMFFRCDGQDLIDLTKTFRLTQTESELIYNAKQGECLLNAGSKKIYLSLNIPKGELVEIDSKYAGEKHE